MVCPLFSWGVHCYVMLQDSRLSLGPNTLHTSGGRNKKQATRYIPAEFLLALLCVEHGVSHVTTISQERRLTPSTLRMIEMISKQRLENPFGSTAPRKTDVLQCSPSWSCSPKK